MTDGVTPADLAAAVRQLADARPGVRLVRNQVGNLAILDGGVYVGYLDLVVPEVVFLDEKPAATELSWHYGPTATDPDPGAMWHTGCGGRVGWFKDSPGSGGYVCDCGAQDGDGSA